MAINLNPAREILNRYGLLRARFLVIAAAIVLVGAYVFLRGEGQEEDMFITVEASRGDISYNIASTGLLQAVVTVQVGSQVSGRIQELHADFNSVVKKGQILAVIDPASFDAQLARSRAAVSMAKANVKNAEATPGKPRGGVGEFQGQFDRRPGGQQGCQVGDGTEPGAVRGRPGFRARARTGPGRP